MPGSSPTPFPPAGERYGRFVLLERIGRGGMAEVFRAVAQGVEGFQRVFVVKRIQREHADNPQLVDMFAKEARISALLNHPNIVQVYDFGHQDGSYFISMEYLRGKDLLAVLRQLRAANRFMAPSLLAMIAREVAAGLAYAHNLVAAGGKSLEIIHRDVSPSNVMLLRAGGVKLLDFGIAKASAALESGRGHTTGTGTVKGKLSYLSPEQVRHEPVDARTDIFSLGVVMWECLTGKRLFHDRSDYHTMNNVLSRTVPAPSTQQPTVPPELDGIVLRALDRDRARRTASAQLLGEELDRFLEKHPLAPRAQSRLLDELFGADGHELEAVPAVGPGSLPQDAETPIMSSVAIRTSSSMTAVTGTSRTDLVPAASPPNVQRDGSARMWPWVAGAVLVVAAFAAGRVFRFEGSWRQGARGVLGGSVEATAPPATVPAPTGEAPAPPAPAAVVAAPEAPPVPTGEAAETTAEAAQLVSLRIESDPPGAEVRGPDGTIFGRTPLTTNVPRGGARLTLTLTLPGHQPARQVIVPDRDLAALVSLRATPARASARAPVRSAPAARGRGASSSAGGNATAEATPTAEPARLPAAEPAATPPQEPEAAGAAGGPAPTGSAAVPAPTPEVKSPGPPEPRATTPADPGAAPGPSTP